MRRNGLIFALLLPSLAGAAPPMIEVGTADQPPPVRVEIDGRELAWDETWPKFRPIEYAVTGALAAAAGATALFAPGPQARWQGGVVFDDAIRDAFRADSQLGRDAAARTSDALVFAVIATPFVDGAITAGLVHGKRDVAWQILLINAESFAVTQGLVVLMKNIAGRERPCGADCTVWGGKETNRSFVSGHAASAFTGAGLVCAHHRNLPLYGGGVADKVACVSALAAATVSGALRVVADDHYTTDVLAGAAIGIFSGYVLPHLLHYGWGGRESARSGSGSGGGFRAAVVPVATPTGGGLSISGVF
jgi:membrane-associated phospholipid phosphatase